MEDENIRLSLQAVLSGGQALRDQLSVVNGLLEQINQTTLEGAAASREHTQAVVQGANQEKGILETLRQKYKDIADAKEKATRLEDIRRYNRELVALEKQITLIDGGIKRWSASQGVLGNQMRSFGGLVAAAFSVAAIKSFGKEILDVTSSMETFHIALTTMLDSKDKADKLQAQVVEIAKKTPFTLREVQEQTTRLLAYGIAGEDVIKTVTNLGNIAAGVGKEKLPFLTLAYGQVRAANRLTGQELRQFTEAGVPLLELLAKQSGKSTAQIQKDISDGAVRFKDIQQAIASAAGEGGKFFNLMEKQSQTIAGRLSNFSDTVDQGLARVGNAFKSNGMQVLDTVSRWTEALIGSNTAVQRTIEWVKAIIALFITYRATMAAVVIQQRLAEASTLQLVGAQRVMYLVTGQVDVAQKGLWATLRANPIGIIVTAIGLAVTAYQAWKASSVEVTSALGEEEAQLRTEYTALVGIVDAIKSTNYSSEQRLALIKKLRTEYPDFLKGIRDENVTNRALEVALKGVNAQYSERIRLARIAFVTEQNQGKRKDLFGQEAEALENLKREFPQAKITALDLASAMVQVRNQVKDTTQAFEDENGVVIRKVDRMTKYHQILARLNKEQSTLTETEVNAAAEQGKIELEAEARKKKLYESDLARQKQLRKRLADEKSFILLADKQELDLITARIKAYEDEHNKVETLSEDTAANDKKWHNDRLTRILAEAKALDDSLTKKIKVLDAEEAIAKDKAKFEKKTAAEIYEISVEFEEKRTKAIEEYEKDREEKRKKVSKLIDDLAEQQLKIQQKLTEDLKKENEKRRKLDQEYTKLVAEQSRLRAELTLEAARATALAAAKTAEQRFAIERRYDIDLANIRISVLNDQIIKENFRVQILKQHGILTQTQALESRNYILKLENEIDAEKAKLTNKDTDREKARAERRRQIERESATMIIQLLGQTENAYLRSLATMLAAYQQFLDKREKGEATWKDKTMLYGQVANAAVGAYFSTQKQYYDDLAQAAADRHATEMDALEKRQAAELDGFKGTEAQKAQIQARQDREKKALEEKQRKEEAELKLKAWKADQASKISQTIQAGALAAIQAWSVGPILGPIFSGIIAGLTIAAVAKIASQKAPKFYRKGTEFVDDKREHPEGIDTVPAMLTRGESVMTVEQNNRKRALGMTNDQLIRHAELTRMVVPRHQFVLEGLPDSKQPSNERLEQLLMEQNREIKRLRKTQITIDKRGFRISEEQRNSKTTYLNNQYFRRS